MADAPLDLDTLTGALAEATDDALHELARRIDRVDLYTYGHSERVCQYALALGREMALSDDRLDLLRRAALVHDLGKVETPAHILKKPGKLTDTEYRTIQRHPSRAHQVLVRIPAYAREAQIARHHHERYDGGGYPDALGGEDIPLLSRVLAVADAYDAMASTRPYRRALEVGEALDRIRAAAGSQLDPICAASFVKIIRDRHLLRAGQIGASTVFAELSIRDYETSVRSFLKRHREASLGGIADLLLLDYPELGSEQAEKIALAVIQPGSIRDDLYSEDVDRRKEDELLVRFPARIDADVRSVVSFEGRLFCVLDIAELDDGRFGYLLKR